MHALSLRLLSVLAGVVVFVCAGRNVVVGEVVYPGRTWTSRTPVEVGMNAAKLQTFAKYVGGRGCVTRYGYMVYSWGDASKRGDVASACKPWYTHFLFKALDDGKITALDDKVGKFAPALGVLNGDLGYKDRDITWRHLANQISCYGITEKPGAAFCYSDWQTALFWDILFLKVYGAAIDNVDQKVLHPFLTQPIHCQDNPTFTPFGKSDRPGRVGVSPRDFCRFGLLYLRKGNWNGKQLISRKHAVMAVTSPLPLSIPRAKGVAVEMIRNQRSIGSRTKPDNQCDHIGSYSWLWWTNGLDRTDKRHWPDAPRESYGCFGHGGPRVMVVIPGLNIVMSWNDATVKGREKENRALKLLVESVIPSPAVTGPRGPLGPDAPLSDVEKKRFAERVTVARFTAAAVQEACDQAARDGTTAVFLPAGQYVFDKQVRVPGGLTVLGAGAKTICRAADKRVCLFRADGDTVRFTRLTLQGADTTPGTSNNTFGVTVSGKQNVRIDHCDLSGFSYATNFADESTAQVDHCTIHHNLRDGLGYGVAIYSGAYVLIMDNEFSQNRHSLASNGALDWSSPKRLGRYIHKPKIRKTHWEFIHNRVGGNDKSPNELCAVDTHPGMDGTFVVEGNIFENLRYAVGVRDGAGLIRRNVFRNLRTVTNFRTLVCVSISYGKHNNIPVEGCMPHDVIVRDNDFVMKEGVKYEKCSVGKAENIVVDGKLIPETKTNRPAPGAIPLLTPMDAKGKLGRGSRRSGSKPLPKTKTVEKDQ